MATSPSKTSATAFDVILEPAKAAPTPPKRKPERPLSAELLEEKIKKAEERRRSYEAEKLTSINTNLKRVEQAQEKIEQFKKETEKKVVERLEKAGENKQAHITAIKEKVAEHMERVKEVKKNKENAPAAVEGMEQE